MTAVFAGLFILQSCEEKKIDFEKLPGTAQAFITQYFPSAEVVFAEKEYGGYEVGITGGLELIFNANGEFVRESR